MTRAGIPPTTVLSRTSRITTALAASTPFSPMAHTWHDRDGCTEPGTSLDDDGRAPGRAALGGIEWVIDGHQVYFGADQYVVANGDTAPVHELAGVIDEDVAPDADVLPEVGIERLHEPERSVHRRAGQAREERAHRGRIALARVHLCENLLRFGDERDDLGVLGIGERDPSPRSSRSRMPRVVMTSLACLMPSYS